MSEDGTAKRKPNKVGGRALLDVDERIVKALAERDEASRKVSLLVYWQDRLTRVNQEIESLIGIQQKLSGVVVAEPIPQAPLPSSYNPIPMIPYSHTATIPNNVSSIPRQAQPMPSGANVASEVEGDSDFR